MAHFGCAALPRTGLVLQQPGCQLLTWFGDGSKLHTRHTVSMAASHDIVNLACVWCSTWTLQISVTPSGTSNMLFNTQKLQGMPKKIKALAKREAQVSMVQQVYCRNLCSLFNTSLADMAMVSKLQTHNNSKLECKTVCTPTVLTVSHATHTPAQCMAA